MVHALEARVAEGEPLFPWSLCPHHTPTDSSNRLGAGEVAGLTALEGGGDWVRVPRVLRAMIPSPSYPVARSVVDT